MTNSPFRFCLNTSTIRCGDLSIVEKIDVTAEAGYDGIEPWVAEMDAHTGSRAPSAALTIAGMLHSIVRDHCAGGSKRGSAP